jgi:tetratricopeptide (TPR) repeat protein
MARIAMIMALVLTMAVAGCNGTGKGPTTAQEIQKAELLRQIELKYENPEAHYQLGKLYYADGLLDKAEWEYRVAIGFNPVHYPAQAGVVKTWHDRKNTERAKIAAELYTSQAATSADASLRLGKAFQNEGLNDYALACYQQAANLAPKSPVVFKQLGYFYLAQGDKTLAEEYLRRSFELDPYQPEVSGELGRMGVIVQSPRGRAIEQTAPQGATQEAP